MGRSDYQRLSQTLLAGLNQQDNLAGPDECSDCRNVWAYNGEIENRPGLRPVSIKRRYDTDGTATGTTADNVLAYVNSAWVNVGSAGTISVFGLGGREDDRIYVEVDTATPTYDAQEYNGVYVTFAGGGTPIEVGAKYYNGTEWKELELFPSTHPNAVQFGMTGVFMTFFRTPSDWATTTVNSVTGYFVAFYRVGSDDSMAGTITITAQSTGFYPGVHSADHADEDTTYSTAPIAATHVFQSLYDNIVTTIMAYGDENNAGVEVLSTSGVKGTSEYIRATESVTIDTRPTVTSVASTNDLFYAFGHKVYRAYVPDGRVTANTEAAVDTRDAAIGPGAPWDSTTVALEGSFPKANIVVSHQNRLWFADIEGDPRKVQWSSKVPYHRVLPSLAFEYLEGGNNERITAMASYGPELIVAEPDELWRMVYAGLDAFDIPHYTPTPLGVGVGCVSHYTMHVCDGRLTFLSEEGIMTYDGTKLQLASSVTRRGQTFDRLANLWRSISPGARWKATAVDWSSRGCYLLAVAVDGSQTNNRIVCWDYKNNAFWVWTSPVSDVASMFIYEDGSGDDGVYLVDQYGDVFQFGRRFTKDGVDEFESYVTTHRVGQSWRQNLRYRECSLITDSVTPELTVTVTRHDRSTSKEQTLTTRDTNETEWTSSGLTFSSGSTPVLYASEERTKTAKFALTGDTFKVKIGNNTNGKRFGFRSVEHGVLPVGRR